VTLFLLYVFCIDFRSRVKLIQPTHSVAALRKSIAFIALLGFLATTFLVLSIADFTRVAGITKAGGILGVITAAIAFYVGLSELLAAEDMAIIQLPLGVFPKRI